MLVHEVRSILRRLDGDLVTVEVNFHNQITIGYGPNGSSHFSIEPVADMAGQWAVCHWAFGELVRGERVQGPTDFWLVVGQVMDACSRHEG